MKAKFLRTLGVSVAILACLTYAFAPGGHAAPGTADTYLSAGSGHADTSSAASLPTATPIKHLVVLFQENVSFDHYFATYPNAANPPGEPPFTALPGTPSVNGLSGSLLTNNPNLYNPFRLDRRQALTCDQGHDYTQEQKAWDGGKMDKFVQFTTGTAGNSLQYCPPSITMGYYDGNTVTAYWNYAQHFAMSDNSFNTVFGPSTPGVLQVMAADTTGATCGTSAVYQAPAACSPTSPGTSPTGTVTSDSDQYYDDCSSGGYGSKNTIAMSGRNIGDMLNAGNATWGWFNGGFTNCTAAHPDYAIDRMLNVDPTTDKITPTGDYSAHHEGFQYYASTSNPHHLPPSSTAMIGRTDQANHQYDLTSFWAAADSGNLPAVSYLKAPKNQDGHAGYSDPLDEQEYVVNTINHLMSLPSWSSTAVIIAYDDSDGWYDHVAGPIVNHSATPLDVGCGTTSDGAPGRCGYGPRLPLLVISPYAKVNSVDHTLTDQTSIPKFIEDNWLNGQRVSTTSFDNKAGTLNNMFDFSTKVTAGSGRYFLDPVTGEPSLSNYGASFAVTFSSTAPGQGYVEFGPSCNALVETATRDLTAGTTTHTVVVTGNDLPGTVGDNGILPKVTYFYRTVTVTAGGVQVDDNGGACYQAAIATG